MKLLGNTRIYGVKLDDIEKERSYTLAATVRDLYDTLNEEGDKITIWLESEGGFTKADAQVKVKSINKVELSENEKICRLNSLLTGANEELTGNDASIYLTSDTRIKVKGGVMPVSFLKHSNFYDIIELEVPDPDLYEIKLDQFHTSNIFRTNVLINGVAVMLE